MKTHKCRYAILASLLFFSNLSFGQGSDSGGNKTVIYSLIGLGLVLLVWAVLNLTDNLFQIEAKKRGADTGKQNYSVFPSFRELFSAKAPSYAGDNQFVGLKKGHDIKLEGEALGNSLTDRFPNRVAISPPDFRGIAPIPKLLVAVGDEVEAGDAVFFDKKDPAIKFVSPVSGEVVDVVRGAKRAINEIVILVDKDQRHKSFQVPDLTNVTREELVDFLAESGLWTSIIKRPFDTIAPRNEVPKNIFISTFDTSPLALDQNIIVSQFPKEFQKGLDVLNKLTEGNVHLGLDANGAEAPHSAFTHATGVVKTYFKGKHPSGNVGIQIHHIDPINSGDVVWTLTVQDVIAFGEMFLSGRYKGDKIIGLVGSKMKEPKMIRTYAGAFIGDLVKDALNTEEKVRLISGDVLTGRTVREDGFISSTQEILTAIKEGDYYELFGWLLPIKPRPTISKTFPNFLFPNHKFEGDTNTHGERRAFVVTGQYESVLPMNLYPQHIMKAIMTNDFERMEGLGLAELSEEDVALCEFVCTSKMPLQSILRQGLEMMREQS